MGGVQGDVFMTGVSLSGGPLPGWRCVGLADFDSDGWQDLVWQHDATREVTVWFLGGATGSSYLSATSLSKGAVPGWRIVGTTDFNGDSKPDLVWQNDASRAVTLWYMGGFSGDVYLGGNSVTGPVPGWSVVSVNDFNVDGKPDMVWQNDTSRSVDIWYLGGTQGNVFQGGASITGPVPGWRAVE